MSDEIKDKDELQKGGEPQDLDAAEQHSDYKSVNRFDASAVRHLSGMYQNWFLDYASYVILERAVPHIEDGLIQQGGEYRGTHHAVSPAW